MAKITKLTAENLHTFDPQAAEAFNALANLSPEIQHIVKLTVSKAMIATVRKIVSGR